MTKISHLWIHVELFGLHNSTNQPHHLHSTVASTAAMIYICGNQQTVNNRKIVGNFPTLMLSHHKQ